MQWEVGYSIKWCSNGLIKPEPQSAPKLLSAFFEGCEVEFCNACWNFPALAFVRIATPFGTTSSLQRYNSQRGLGAEQNHYMRNEIHLAKQKRNDPDNEPVKPTFPGNLSYSNGSLRPVSRGQYVCSCIVQVRAEK